MKKTELRLRTALETKATRLARKYEDALPMSPCIEGMYARRYVTLRTEEAFKAGLRAYTSIVWHNGKRVPSHDAQCLIKTDGQYIVAGFYRKTGTWESEKGLFESRVYQPEDVERWAYLRDLTPGSASAINNGKIG